MSKSITNRFVRVSVSDFKAEMRNYIHNNYCLDMSFSFDDNPDSYPGDIFGFECTEFDELYKDGYSYGKLNIDIQMLPGLTKFCRSRMVDGEIFYCFCSNKTHQGDDMELVLEKGQKFRLSRYLTSVINKYELLHNTWHGKIIDNNIAFGFYLVPRDKVFLYLHEAKNILKDRTIDEQVDIIYDDLKRKYPSINKNIINEHFSLYKNVWIRFVR